MKSLMPICISFAVSLSLLAPMAEASKPAGKMSCASTAAKKADQNFKTQKLVTGLIVGGVSGLVIRTMIEKSRGTPKGAVMSRGGGMMLKTPADKKQWEKHYKQSLARCRLQAPA